MFEQRVGIERVVFCLFPRRDSARVAALYALDVDVSLTWEGASELPRREAAFIDQLLSDLPQPWLAPYLNLIAAHRRLCASELEAGAPESERGAWMRDAQRQLALGPGPRQPADSASSRSLSLQLLDRVALRFEHRDDAVRADQVRGADDDERAAATAEQRLDLAASSSCSDRRAAADTTPAPPCSSACTMRSTVSASPLFQASASLPTLASSVSSSFSVCGQHPILLLHGHPVEDGYLVVRRFETLNGLARLLRLIVEMLVEAELGVEAGLLQLETLRARPRASTV